MKFDEFEDYIDIDTIKRKFLEQKKLTLYEKLCKIAYKQKIIIDGKTSRSTTNPAW